MTLPLRGPGLAGRPRTRMDERPCPGLATFAKSRPARAPRLFPAAPAPGPQAVPRPGKEAITAASRPQHPHGLLPPLAAHVPGSCAGTGRPALKTNDPSPPAPGPAFPREQHHNTTGNQQTGRPSAVNAPGRAIHRLRAKCPPPASSERQPRSCTASRDPPLPHAGVALNLQAMLGRAVNHLFGPMTPVTPRHHVHKCSAAVAFVVLTRPPRQSSPISDPRDPSHPGRQNRPPTGAIGIQARM